MYKRQHPFSVNVRTLWVSTSRTEWCLHLRTEWYDHCPNGPCTSGQSAIMCKYAPVLVHQITQVPGTYRYHVYTRIRRCVSPAPPPRWADFPCSISPQLISWRCKKRRRWRTSRRKLSEVSFAIGTLLVVEQSSLQNRPRRVMCDTHRIRYTELVWCITHNISLGWRIGTDTAEEVVLWAFFRNIPFPNTGSTRVGHTNFPAFYVLSYIHPWVR